MVKKSENPEKSQKSQKFTFFQTKKMYKKKMPKKKKKCYPLSFPKFGGRDSTRVLQSIPFQNPGGYPERDGRRTKDGRTDGQRKSLCLILDVVINQRTLMFSIIFIYILNCLFAMNLNPVIPIQ